MIIRLAEYTESKAFTMIDCKDYGEGGDSNFVVVRGKCACTISQTSCWLFYHLHSTVYASRFLLTGYVGLLLCSTAVDTTSQSTAEGTMRVL